LATSLNSTNGWVQIDLGQLYNINSIKVKSTTGANNIANNPDATNDLVIFTSETSMETSPSISELRNQSNVNEIGITSGINYFNREQKFSTSNIVVKDIIIDNTIPIATMEETAALISADIEVKSNETGTAYLFKDTLDLTSQSLDIFDNYVSDITANTAIKTEISANALTKISTSDLEAGCNIKVSNGISIRFKVSSSQYHLYIIDTAGNIST
jgi:CO dehydrogenase/acetyl-CoA synthase epsilon subunit